MADQIHYYAIEIQRHVPMVTSLGVAIALPLSVVWFSKRSNGAGLLSLVCVAYALTPFVPSW